MNEEIPQELIDAANRMRDAVNLHVAVANTTGERLAGFVAIKLEDGRSDGTLYETRRDAVRHTANRGRGWFYAKVGADTMPLREAIIVLQMARKAFANGVVFAEEDPVVPQMAELVAPYIPKTIKGLDLFLPPQRRIRL